MCMIPWIHFHILVAIQVIFMIYSPLHFVGRRQYVQEHLEKVQCNCTHCYPFLSQDAYSVPASFHHDMAGTALSQPSEDAYFLLSKCLDYRSLTTMNLLCKARLKGYMQTFCLEEIPQNWPVRVVFFLFSLETSNTFYSHPEQFLIPLFHIPEKPWCAPPHPCSRDGAWRREIWCRHHTSSHVCYSSSASSGGWSVLPCSFRQACKPRG